MSRYLHSLMEFYNHNGWFPGGGMVGNHVISVLTGAWAKGIHSFDPDLALRYYFQTATSPESRADYKFYFTNGYIPAPNDTTITSEATSRTLAYAYDDFCAYKLAKMTGNTYYKRYFAQYMYNYKNVFDPQTNFMRGKGADGNWFKYFNPYRWGGPFTEGNSWQWTFAVFHDIQGLINLMGGAEAFNTKLDNLFHAPSDSFLIGSYGYRIHELSEMVAESMGQYAGGNEPSFHIGYLYTYSGQPWKTQRIVRKAMKRLFGPGPKGYPGDVDGGTAAAWYVMSALGFYSVTPATNQYVLGSPIFEKAIITMENGNKFVIKAENNSPSNVYIQHATLDGKPYSHNWITYDDIVSGGVLHFEMGPQPNKKRGIEDADKPFSLTNKQTSYRRQSQKEEEINPSVLILGGGSSHDFGRWFNLKDVKTLSEIGARVRYTNHPQNILSVLQDIDILYLCNNQPLTNPELRRAIFNFVESGNDLLLVHAATWYNWKNWPEYNRWLVGGGSREHQAYGKFKVKVVDRSHPVMESVPTTFYIKDELYRFRKDEEGSDIHVLAIGMDSDTGKKYPVVWTVDYGDGDIICITLGHDKAAHTNKAYKTILQNSIKWLSRR